MRTSTSTAAGTSGGEIVQVQGGHIFRSIERKDRHSKVYTSKGPRDRRVRLSAHTAIQFYDVQDRLGYDRPSKAVDWLIKKAKNAIDKLDELPPWQPDMSLTATTIQPHQDIQDVGHGHTTTNIMPMENQSFHLLHPHDHDHDDTIHESMKSFNFSTNNNYPSEDLGLSLHGGSYQTHHHDHQQSTFSVPLEFEPNFNRPMVTWLQNNQSAVAFGSVQMQDEQQQFRGVPLQSSTHSFLQPTTPRNVDDFGNAASSSSHDHEYHRRATSSNYYQSSIFATRFGSDGLPAGFSFPARIYGDDHHHDNAIDHNHRPSSSSPSNSHH